MTSGADPVLLEQLAETQSAVEHESAEISRDVHATEAEIAEENRAADEANEQFSRELDEEVEQRRAEQVGDGAKHRSPGQPAQEHIEHAFGFEDDDEFRNHQPVVSESVSQTPPRHRRSPEPEFDEDEDFSKTNWLS